MTTSSPLSSLFFQAEDGIRDWSVTGVQTCALRSKEKETRCAQLEEELNRTKQLRERIEQQQRQSATELERMRTELQQAATDKKRVETEFQERSEERRVGKECRVGWSTDAWENKRR